MGLAGPIWGPQFYGRGGGAFFTRQRKIWVTCRGQTSSPFAAIQQAQETSISRSSPYAVFRGFPSTVPLLDDLRLMKTRLNRHQTVSARADHCWRCFDKAPGCQGRGLRQDELVDQLDRHPNLSARFGPGPHSFFADNTSKSPVGHGQCGAASFPPGIAACACGLPPTRWLIGEGAFRSVVQKTELLIPLLKWDRDSTGPGLVVVPTPV